MSTVNNILNNDISTYSNYQSTAAKDFLNSIKKDSAENAKETEEGVVYEKGEEAGATTSKTYTQNTALVNKLKADADARVNELKSIVEKLITGQGEAFATANDIWSLFANGDFSNVSEAAKAQAQEDISENGYWGVKETSARIVDFAKALTGGDPSKIDKMVDAFKKGFDEATAAWGKELPSISSETYDAVMKGFEDWKKEASPAE